MKKKLIITFALLAIILCVAIISLLLKTSNNTTYKVTFVTNGGTKIVAQEIEKGKKVTKPKDPTKEGYIFVEWLHDGQKYDFSCEVIADLILTANWIEKKQDGEIFIAKFNSDGGTTIANQIVEKGNKITKPSDPVKEGYLFKGWMFNNQDYDFNTVIEKNIELTAKWEKIKEDNANTNNNTNNPNTSNNNKPSTNNNSTPTPAAKKYTVSFESNGGTEVASQTVIEGNKVSQPNSPERQGHKFIEWQLNGNSYNFNSNVNQNITLVAKWELIKYSIKYELNGGKIGIMPTKYDINSGSFMINDPSKEGYTFECWNVYNDADGNVYSPQKNLTITIKKIDTNNIKIYIEGYSKSYSGNTLEWKKYSKETQLGNLSLEAVWKAN